MTLGLNVMADAACDKYTGRRQDGIYGQPGQLCVNCGWPRSEHQSPCPHVLMIKGESFRCEMNFPHEGWAHSNRAAEAIWGAGDDSNVTVEMYRSAVKGEAGVEFHPTVDPAKPLIELLRWMIQNGIGNVPYPNATVDTYLREKENP